MSSILRVSCEQVVGTEGKPVILRGAGLGGWMNMENFITGYTGHEKQHRASMLKVLGKEKYEFFFDRFLTYFFTEADAKFFASLGLNCLRIPFNYRHFIDDMNPGVLKEEGFKHLDRVVDLCAKEGIYTILDLHALPGGQNPDWHSDNPTNEALFWEFKVFQDQVVWLWEHIAAHYKENPWVAGYNPLNEPADFEHTRLVAYYDRIEAAIRRVDPDHILWFDGNTFAADFGGFDRVLPNSVYALHDYSNMGFPAGERYKGTPEQDAKVLRQYLRKAEFMKKYKVPVWNGEFGPVYDPDSDEINQERYNLLGKQLEIYDQRGKIAWSIWLYKDIGVQGMIYADPESKWIKTLAPFLEKKRRLQADAWGYWPSKALDDVFNPVVKFIEENIKNANDKYPDTWNVARHVARSVKQCLMSDILTLEFAEYFKGMDLEELDEMARSFAFENCKQREGLNKILREHAKAAA